MGSSVRGAIDLALVLTGLAELRGEARADAPGDRPRRRLRRAVGPDPDRRRRRPHPGVGDRRAAGRAVAGRLPDAGRGGPGSPGTTEGKADRLPGPPRQASSPAPARVGNTPDAPRAAQQLAARHPAFDEVSPELGRAGRGGVRRRSWPRDPEAAAALLADLAVATDARCGRRPGGWPAGCSCGWAGSARRARAGTRRLGPSRSLEGDLDLDRTLERWSPGRSGRPEADDLVTRTWTAHRRAVCLVVDISGLDAGAGRGAGRGRRGRGGAGQRARPGRPLEPSVLAFGAGVRVLQAQGVRRAPEELLSELVALRGHGVTDLAAGLRAAAVPAGRRRSPTSGWWCCSRTACTPPATTRPARWAGSTGCTCWSRWAAPEAEAAAAALAARGGGRAQTVRRLADIGPGADPHPRLSPRRGGPAVALRRVPAWARSFRFTRIPTTSRSRPAARWPGPPRPGTGWCSSSPPAASWANRCPACWSRGSTLADPTLGRVLRRRRPRSAPSAWSSSASPTPG